MVTTLTVDQIATQVAPKPFPVPVKSPARPSGTCTRCGSRMFRGHDEPECVTCGHADYTHTEEIEPRWKRTSIVSASTRYIARYMGNSNNLSDTLTHVRLVPKGNRAVYSVTCPFCSNLMEESSLSGKRMDPREQRFKCYDGHRVSIIPRRNGMLGWK